MANIEVLPLEEGTKTRNYVLKRKLHIQKLVLITSKSLGCLRFPVL